MNTKKTIGITVIFAIAVSLLLTSGAYAQSSVSFSDSGSGSTFKGEGSSASVGEACSGDDPYVEKTKSVAIFGPGSDHQSCCGYISAETGDPTDTANDPYMFVEVDCEQVDVSVRVRGAGSASADAGIMAWAELFGLGDEGVAETAIWAAAYAAAGPGTGKARADAKAEGRAHAELDASGFFDDEAVLTADSEGIAKAHACTTNKGMLVTSAETESAIAAYAEFGSLNEVATLYSNANVAGGDNRRSVARADGSAEGSASASGYRSDMGVDVDWSVVGVMGTADTNVKVRGEADAGSFAEATSYNYVEGEDLEIVFEPELMPIGDVYIEIFDAELIDTSLIVSGSHADVFAPRASARAEGYVSADTYAEGMTWKPDVWLDSFTDVSGEAGSLVSVVKDGAAESYAGAIALNVVDGDVYVDYDIMPLVDVELDMLDVTALGSLSWAEGLSSRTRVYTHDWVDADTFAGSSMYVEDTWPPCPPPCPPPSPDPDPELAYSGTSGSADQVIKGRGLGSASSAAGAGAIAATEVVDWLMAPGVLIVEELAAVGVGTGVEAEDGSKMYPMACLKDVETYAGTLSSVNAEITDGSGNSWLNPRANRGGSVVNGALVLLPDGTVMTEEDNDLGSGPNYAYGYLAGYSIIEP